MSTEQPGTESSSGGGLSLPDVDWPTMATERLDDLVSKARDKTKLVDKIARYIVYGVVAAVLGLMFLIVFLIALVRLLDAYVPIHPYGRKVWVVYLILGAIFVGGGLFFWVKGKRAPTA